LQAFGVPQEIRLAPESGAKSPVAAGAQWPAITAGAIDPPLQLGANQCERTRVLSGKPPSGKGIHALLVAAIAGEGR